MIEIFFLGVGGSVPRPAWGLPSVAVKRHGEVILFDCGEGTQVAYLAAGLGVNRPLTVLISHLHGDHVFGLPPLLYSLSLHGRTSPVRVYGPKGLREYLDVSIKTGGRGLSFELEIEEISTDDIAIIIDCDEYVIEAGPADHTTESLFFVLREKTRPGKFDVSKAEKLGVPAGPLRKLLQRGQPVALPNGRIIRPSDVLGPPRPGVKVVYSGDTRPSHKLLQAAYGADILIHDAMFLSDLERDAYIKGHSTALEAAKLASEARVSILFLFHYSQRYKDLSPLLAEARRVHRASYLSLRGLKVCVERREAWVLAWISKIF